MLEDRCVKNLEWCWQGHLGHAMNNAFVSSDVARFAEVMRMSDCFLIQSINARCLR